MKSSAIHNDAKAKRLREREVHALSAAAEVYARAATDALAASVAAEHIDDAQADLTRARGYIAAAQCAYQLAEVSP